VVRGLKHVSLIGISMWNNSALTGSTATFQDVGEVIIKDSIFLSNYGDGHGFILQNSKNINISSTIIECRSNQVAVMIDDAVLPVLPIDSLLCPIGSPWTWNAPSKTSARGTHLCLPTIAHIHTYIDMKSTSIISTMVCK
jgi:hypothetical protein